MAGKITCKKCKEVKDCKQFRRTGRFGISYVCIKCNREIMAEKKRKEDLEYAEYLAKWGILK